MFNLQPTYSVILFKKENKFGFNNDYILILHCLQHSRYCYMVYKNKGNLIMK